jgi:Rho-binding antiterminator
MSPERPYTPIDCSLHDRLESAATLRKPVCIAYRGSGTELSRIEDRIVDIFTRDGVEFMKLDNGTEIRLDDIVSVDGVAFTRGSNG